MIGLFFVIHLYVLTLCSPILVLAPLFSLFLSFFFFINLNLNLFFSTFRSRFYCTCHFSYQRHRLNKESLTTFHNINKKTHGYVLPCSHQGSKCYQPPWNAEWDTAGLTHVRGQSTRMTPRAKGSIDTCKTVLALYLIFSLYRHSGNCFFQHYY